MKNKELIAILEKNDPEALIDVQCWGYYYPITDVEIQDDGNIILKLDD